MNEQAKVQLKKEIDQAKLISFDVFDTLLFRKTNSPEAIFDLVGKHFGIHGFRKIRMDAQNEASTRTYRDNRYPHANMDEIYSVLSERTDIPVDWNAVKDFEIQIERDALTPNQELLEIYRYAKDQGKRVVATSDMYLSAGILSDFLREKGFRDLDYVYCSADEHKAKFNRDLFEVLAEKENVAYADILHIGDKARDDVEFPQAYGINAFLYQPDADMQKVSKAAGSDVDNGIYKILADSERGFWYNFGVEVGGPLYMGLLDYLEGIIRREGKKIFFLARDGYNLYHIFKKMGFSNIEYLYTSRRALTMAAITEMNQRDMDSLPPYTFGQTVGEILDYLRIDRTQITRLSEVGFQSFDDVIKNEDDQKAFRQLYVLEKDIFLRQCSIEREGAKKYFQSVGFLEEDAICFDCGWQGSSQELIEVFKNTIHCQTNHKFVYFGIKNCDKSRKQLHNRQYEAYMFDFWSNQSLQADLHDNVVMYELLFSAPHESVYYYNQNGEVVFEDGDGNREKNVIFDGIFDFVSLARDFVKTYMVEYTPEISVGHLKRLIHMPTETEAITIGDLDNVDGFARKQGEQKHVAFVTREQLDMNPNSEIYWLTGLLKRPDIADDIKKECASKRGVVYPPVMSEYHLEDPHSIRSYYRWIQRQKKPIYTLNYHPCFSVVIPVYNTVTEQLEACFDSVLSQNYDNFELILVDDHSSWDNVRPVLQRYAANEKVRVIYRSTNGHISVATNDGISAAKGDFIVFMDCDDTIEPDALYSFAEKLNENPDLDFIYSDEDKITEDSKIRHLPFFKPDWSPDLFLNMMYTNHLAAYRADLVRQIGGLRTAYNGSQDYDFTLRFMEKSSNNRVGHVSKVLYHWRERKESVAYAMNSKNYASEAARHAKDDYIRRNNIPAKLEPIDGMCQYRIVYDVVGEPLVSIIIPSKDHPQILHQCIESIRRFTDYSNYEIIVVDNGSNEENKAKCCNYLHSVGAKYVYEKADFNFSAMCNLGAKNAKGSFFLFLNDDIEIFQPQWLRRMLGHAQQKHTGAVGAKLYYPQSTILQHAGVINTSAGPIHSFMRLNDQVPYYFGWNRVDCNCIAVTGACLLLAADKFHQVGGFDEDLPVAYNDVKLCFALHRAGYYNVVRNDVVAYHHESLSRGSDQIDDEKLIRLSRELTGLFSQFPELLNRDPYLNENLQHYCAGLELKDGYDILQEMDISGSVEPGIGVVDFVEITEKIRVFGWSVLEGDPHIANRDRYLVFKDPYGKTYGAKVLPFQRADVAESFGNPEYLYAGFECILPKDELRVDIMPYQMGILTVDEFGGKHLCWCGETNVVRGSKARPLVLPYCEAMNFTQQNCGRDVQWYLDECTDYGCYHRIRGFAFVKGGRHYCYKKKLILRGNNGHVLEMDVYSEERVDVAYTFFEEHFLFNTGYICYVYHNSLMPNTIYDVIIRLSNQFDPEDVLDITTGGQIQT